MRCKRARDGTREPLAAPAMQRCVKRWDPFGGPARIGAADVTCILANDTEVLSRAVLPVSGRLVGLLLHNIATCKSRKNLAAQKRTLVCPHRKRSRALWSPICAVSP